MLDALPNALPFTCTKCGGIGQFRTYGRCGECRGKGGFASSPEARAKAKDRAKARAIRAARTENQSNPGLYLGVIQNQPENSFLASLKDDDLAGRVWTETQKQTARGVLDGFRAAQKPQAKG